MSWTEPGDVSGAWIGDGAPTSEEQIQIWINKAEREIKYRVADLQARIDAEAAETPSREDLKNNAVDVTVAMVIRVFRNPEGFRQKQWTTGPFSESGTVGGDNPGQLYLTDDELAKLQGARSSGAFTVSMIPTTSPFYVEPA